MISNRKLQKHRIGRFSRVTQKLLIFFFRRSFSTKMKLDELTKYTYFICIEKYLLNDLCIQGRCICRFFQCDVFQICYCKYLMKKHSKNVTLNICLLKLRFPFLVIFIFKDIYRHNIDHIPLFRYKIRFICIPPFHFPSFLLQSVERPRKVIKSYVKYHFHTTTLLF